MGDKHVCLWLAYKHLHDSESWVLWTHRIFHVTIPVGVYIGHDIIREAMRRSLRESVSVRLDIPDKAMQRGVSRTELAA